MITIKYIHDCGKGDVLVSFYKKDKMVFQEKLIGEAAERFLNTVTDIKLRREADNKH